MLIANARISDLIREDRPDEITEAIAEGDFFEMQTFSKALIQLVVEDKVDREDHAANAASNRHDFLTSRSTARSRSRPPRPAHRDSVPDPDLENSEPGDAADEERAEARSGAAEPPRRRPAIAMRRLLPFLGAALVLALALSSAAGADTFRVEATAY